MQRRIRLHYSENQFTIHMASDNGGVNNATRFIYQLKGFNDKWIKTTAVNPDITYMSLPPGSYTLCVRMLKDDGTMGEQESQLDIIIDSPWYTSWWAWTLYGLLLVIVAFIWKNAARIMAYLKLCRSRREIQEKPSEKTPSDEESIEEAVLMNDDE